MFMPDSYVLNGQVHGPLADRVVGTEFTPSLMRPFFETDPNHPYRGRPCVRVPTGESYFDEKTKTHKRKFKTELIQNLQARGINSAVWNATTLRKQQWTYLDQKVVMAVRRRLRVWADLAAANQIGGFDGFSSMVYEYETASDPLEAVIDMDLQSAARNDTPLYQLQGLPLPITHADFYMSKRRLAISQKGGSPLDTAMGEAAARRVAEITEKLTLGTVTGPIYGGNSTQVGGYGRTSQVYGYTNFPARTTKTNMTAPTAGGWSPQTTINEFLACRDLLTFQGFTGPFMVYTSNDWDAYLDRDYVLTGGNVATQTLRERLKAVGDIADVRRADMLFASQLTGPDATSETFNPFTMIWVQMTPEVAAAVVGQDITTLQWEERGGMRLQFIVFCIMVPLLRADYYGRCGILVATTS